MRRCLAFVLSLVLLCAGLTVAAAEDYVLSDTRLKASQQRSKGAIEKVFSPDLKNGTDIFDMRGVDRQQGALVVVRPDQYIAHVLPLNAHAELAAFFAGFMLER